MRTNQFRMEPHNDPLELGEDLDALLGNEILFWDDIPLLEHIPNIETTQQQSLGKEAVGFDLLEQFQIGSTFTMEEANVERRQV